MNEAPSFPAPARLLPGLAPVAIVIAIVSLSVHVVMLQVLHVPYPDLSGVGKLGLVLVALRTLALLIVYRLIRPRLGSLSVAGRIAAVALLDVAMAGNVRTAVMEAVVTTGPTFPALKLLVQLAESLVLATLVVASRRLIRQVAGLFGTALALTGVMTVLIAPAMRAAVAPFAGLRRPEVYVEPYGLYVLSWSYATFLETVGAVFAVAVLSAGRLSAKASVALLQFTLLILLLRGTLVMQLLFPWSMRGDVLRSMLSTGQFFLQDLVLAMLVWLAWRRFDRRQSVRADLTR